MAISLGMFSFSDAHATRVLGGGPPKSDCYSSFEVAGATASGKRTAECHDGDAACDTDGQANGKCEFSVSLCVFQTDVTGCTPLTITKIPKSGFQGLTFPVSATTCGTAKTFKVKEGKRRAVRLVAHADGKPKLDRDTLTLKCSTAVASPAGAFLDE
jgi:hypothetical protein